MFKAHSQQLSVLYFSEVFLPYSESQLQMHDQIIDNTERDNEVKKLKEINVC